MSKLIWSSSILIALTWLSLSGSRLGAQTIPIINLRPANGKFPVELSNITSVRELSNGTVLVTDERESRIIAINPESGATTNVSRKGDGPGEFRNVYKLWTIGRDSSLMIDQNGRRWLAFDGIKPSTLPSTNPGEVGVEGNVNGFDLKGFIVGTRMALPKKYDGMSREDFEKILSDSLTIVRISRATGRSDTIGRFPGGGEPWGGTVQGGTKPSRGGPPVFAVSFSLGDDITVFPDGWVAVNRGYPHRVDWCAPNSKCSTGPLLPIPVREMNEADKIAFLKWESVNVGHLPAKVPPTQVAEWPKYLPVFLPPLLALPDGRLLAHRFPRGDQPLNEYYLITRAGAINGRFTLPLDERVVGLGSKMIYIVSRDSDGIERLSRHPWP